ncbi:MAG: hypothetical protein JWP40_1245 [Blastococcus sp.]|jgi:hypothetical protein|nr:hypothetical protein [Blastococcus sp.]
MRAIGMLTTVLGLTAFAGAVVLGVRSIPDIKRYLEIRRM